MMTTISTARRAGACGPVSVDGTGVFRPVLRRDLMAAVRRTRRHYGLNTGDVLVLVEVTLDTDGTVRLGASELVSGERLQLEHVFHAGLARSDVVRLAKQLADARA